MLTCRYELENSFESYAYTKLFSNISNFKSINYNKISITEDIICIERSSSIPALKYKGGLDVKSIISHSIDIMEYININFKTNEITSFMLSSGWIEGYEKQEVVKNLVTVKSSCDFIITNKNATTIKTKFLEDRLSTVKAEIRYLTTKCKDDIIDELTQVKTNMNT